MKFAFETMKGFLVCLVGSLRVEEEKEEERKGAEKERKRQKDDHTFRWDGGVDRFEEKRAGKERRKETRETITSTEGKRKRQEKGSQGEKERLSKEKRERKKLWSLRNLGLLWIWCLF